MRFTAILFAAILGIPCFAVEGVPDSLRDITWVWGNPEMGKPGPHTPASYAEAYPMERARLLGASNVIMAGNGIPAMDEEAIAYMTSIGANARVVWEMNLMGDEGAAPFAIPETIARAARLAERFPNIEGVLLDDMTTVAIDKGFTPEHLRALRSELEAASPGLDLWGVVYSMSLSKPGLAEYVRELDVINLWIWHGEDTPFIAHYVAQCERLFPGKPIVVGLYMHDYGGGHPMPANLLERQCAIAKSLVEAGRIEGLVFLSIDSDAEAIQWTADWLAGNGDGPLPPPAASLRLGEGWQFSGDAWTQDADGIIRPPDQRNLHSRAFDTQAGYCDVVVEFEFNGSYRETGTGSAGLILGAKDPNHFSLVYFPWGGQQLRAKHFWAGLAEVDGDAFLRHTQFEFIPGLPSETERWYRVRVEAQDGMIRVWVDDRKALEAPAPDIHGCLGLAGYGWYAFRNIRVRGAAQTPMAWTDAPIPVHAFTVGLDSQVMPSGCVAPNGDVLLAVGAKLVRSKDRGRTWLEAEALPEHLGEIGDYGSTMFSAAGKVRAMVYRTQDQTQATEPEVLMAVSDDNGTTWNEPEPSAVAGGWPEVPANLVPYGPMLQSRDGSWARFLLGSAKEDGDHFTDVRTWSSIHAKAFVIRSLDQGASWSAPIDLDWPSWVDVPRGTLPGSLDLTEPTGVSMGNTLMVLVRPVYSATMWQCWSDDAGATWDAASRATFPGYAQSMIRTSSGAILCVHRYPHYAVNQSWDSGLHWDAGTVIDYPVWGMGCLVEVEPDVVLSAYMNAERNMPLLVQLLKAERQGVRPIRVP